MPLRCFLAATVIVLAALAAYHNSFRGPLILDDLHAIPKNPTIRHLWPIWTVFTPPPDMTVSGRPVLNLTLAINYALSGTEVWSYHALNVLIHILAGLTLFGLVRRTLLFEPNSKLNIQGSATNLAFCVGLLWTLHPLQTEAVTYIIQRAESLMGLFYFLTLYCFIRFADRSQEPGVGRQNTKGKKFPAPSILWPIASVLCCLAGMTTKEVMATAPLIVFLYDRTFVAGTFRDAWKQHWKYHLCLAATWLLLGYLVLSTGGNRSGTVGFGVSISPGAYWLTQFQAIAHYLWLSFWPNSLVFEYGGTWVRRAAEVIPYAITVLALLAGTAWALRRKPALGFLGAWFFVILAPTSLMPGVAQTVVEHRMYLSLAAVVVLLIWGVYRLAGGTRIFIILALAVACGFLTARRNEDYRSALAIWTDTEAKRPGNPLAHDSRGNALLRMGRADEAVQEYKEALRLRPNYAEAHTNLGNVLAQMGRNEEALGEYQEALRIRPYDAETHTNLGNAFVQLGRVSEALNEYGQALELEPESAEAHYNLAVTLDKMNRPAEAIDHYRQAVQLKPDYAEAYYNLGNVLSQNGQLAEAINAYQSGLQLDPDSVRLHNNLGSVLMRTGKMAEAEEQYRQVLRLEPNNAGIRRNFSDALLQTGKISEAIEQYRKTLQLEPENISAHNNLGIALARAGRISEAIAECREVLRVDPNNATASANLAKLQTMQR